jgi:SAM-dependent methyltransferase
MAFPLNAETFRCPACRAALRREGDRLACAGCGASYEVREEIPVFFEAGDEADLQEMAELVARLEAAPASDLPGVADHFRLPTRRHDLGRRTAEEKSFRGFFRRFPDLSRLRILDVSCGVGREAQILLERGAAEVHLLDISYPAVRYARQAFGRFYPDRRLAFSVSDAGRLPYADGTFDLVLVYGSGHHYPDLDGFLSEARRVADRVVLLAEPARMGAAQRLLDAMGWNTEYGGLDTHRFDEAELRRRLAAHGLRCETERLFQYFPRALARMGDVRPLVAAWFGLLGVLDVCVPRDLRHSLNVYASRG